jgi:predicted lipoprotein with Yx(FWY)xxD motif
MTTIASRRETVAMSASVGSLTPGTTRAGAGLTVALGSGLVMTTKSGSAGAFLTNGSGRTVYLWTKDGKNSSACAGAWPPVTTTGPVTATGGVVMADLCTVSKPGGGTQVVYDGHPVGY